MSGLEKFPLTVRPETETPTEAGASAGDGGVDPSPTFPLPVVAPQGDDEDDMDARPSSQPKITASVLGGNVEGDKAMTDSKAAIRPEASNFSKTTVPGAVAVRPGVPPTLGASSIKADIKEERGQTTAEADEPPTTLPGAVSVGPVFTIPSKAKEDERLMANAGSGSSGTSSAVRSSFLSRMRPSRFREKRKSGQGPVPGTDEMNKSKLGGAGLMTPSEKKDYDGGDRQSLRPVRPTDPASEDLTNDMVEQDGNELASNSPYVREGGMVTAQVIDEQELEAQYHARIVRDAVAADVVDVEELKEKGRGWKISVAIVCIVAIVLAIAIPLSQDDKDPPTPSPTVQLPSDFLYDLFFPYSGSALDDLTTPQYRAFNWLLNDDPAQLPLKETNDTTLMERYAAAVFYYSTGGDNWIDKHYFLSNRSLCEWIAADGSTGFFCPEESASPANLEMGKYFIFDYVRKMLMLAAHDYPFGLVARSRQ